MSVADVCVFLSSREGSDLDEGILSGLNVQGNNGGKERMSAGQCNRREAV